MIKNEKKNQISCPVGQTFENNDILSENPTKRSIRTERYFKSIMDRDPFL